MDVPALLAWYRARRRVMPWRTEVSPYRTLVSELMLQQTRVDTVIPYFERFMEAFPTVEALAAAPLDAVLLRWAGLGYYSRARNLHAAARVVVERGGFPDTVEGLRALPGVGPYTAGAVASIALGLDAPLVDGNVERVLCRQLALAVDPKREARRLWGVAASLVPAGEAGDFNQALMELGATVCTPARPSCVTCPVRASCAGVGDPSRYPAPKQKAPVPELDAVAVVVRSGEGILLAQRPGAGLLAGLWEPPAGRGQDPVGMARERLGMELVDLLPATLVTHRFSHLVLRTRVWVGRAVGEIPAPPATAGGDRVFPRYVRAGRFPASDPPALSTLAQKWLAAAPG